jgi:tRNA uridine 5-carboxymethylaminomethyl modification enzyme
MEKGYNLGLVSKDVYNRFLEKKRSIESEIKRLSETIIYPDAETKRLLVQLNTEPIKKPVTLKELLRRPEISYPDIVKAFGGNNHIKPDYISEIETEVKLEGYIKVQIEEVKRFQRAENDAIPEWLDYSVLPGLSRELREKLSRIRPVSLGQASRIPGMTPAALCILMYAIKGQRNIGKGD